MIKEIKRVYEKYRKISENSEYVSVHEIINDLYRLIGEARIKRIPKKDR